MVRLIDVAKEMGFESAESKKKTDILASLDDQLLELVRNGLSLRQISKTLRRSGFDISFGTVQTYLIAQHPEIYAEVFTTRKPRRNPTKEVDTEKVIETAPPETKPVANEDMKNRIATAVANRMPQND